MLSILFLFAAGTFAAAFVTGLAGFAFAIVAAGIVTLTNSSRLFPPYSPSSGAGRQARLGFPNLEPPTPDRCIISQRLYVMTMPPIAPRPVVRHHPRCPRPAQ